MTEEKNGANGVIETKVKLKIPFNMPDGRAVEELDVDIRKLNLGDLHNLEMEYASLFPGVSPTNGIFMTDTKYQSLILARINGMVYDNIRGLNAVDAFNVTNRMGRFLAESA